MELGANHKALTDNGELAVKLAEEFEDVYALLESARIAEEAKVEDRQSHTVTPAMLAEVISRRDTRRKAEEEREKEATALAELRRKVIGNFAYGAAQTLSQYPHIVNTPLGKEDNRSSLALAAASGSAMVLGVLVSPSIILSSTTL